MSKGTFKATLASKRVNNCGYAKFPNGNMAYKEKTVGYDADGKPVTKRVPLIVVRHKETVIGRDGMCHTRFCTRTIPDCTSTAVEVK